MAKEYDRQALRNVGLFSHGGAGKTSVGEAMLFCSGVTSRLGLVAEGTSILDYEPEAKNRVSSISLSVSALEWEKHKINLVDTPGDPNFVAEARNALRAVDAGVFLVDAVDGVKVLTIKLWAEAKELGLPAMLFVNKLDRERSDFAGALESIKTALEVTPCPLTIPLGEQDKLQGVVDLLRMKALLYEKDGSGKFKEGDIPAEAMDEAKKFREKMVETIAESDDALLEKYLEEGDLNPKELASALRVGVLAGKVVPLLCGSGVKNIGAHPLLHAIVSCFPSPLERPAIPAAELKSGAEVKREPKEDAPFSALVFKTIADPYRGKLTLFRVFSGVQMADTNTYNASKKLRERLGQILQLSGEAVEGVNSAKVGDIVAVAKLKETQTGDSLADEAHAVVLPVLSTTRPVISFAVVPKTQADEDKLTQALSKLIEEDPTLDLKRDIQTNEFILSGMGQVHIETALQKMQRKFGVGVNLKAPKVPYLETIRGTASAEGKYRKQTGGRGQFGWCWVEVSSLPRGSGVEFEDAIFGGSIPRQFIPSVEKGMRDAAAKGIIAGYPVTDFKLKLYDGKYHDVDSSDLAFQIAGSLGFKAAAEKAGVILLEPIMNVEITVPDECMGDVTGDLNRRRGRLQGMEGHAGAQVIKATAPLAEMLRYAPDLNSLTSGRGLFTMEFSHYEEVPPHIAEKVVAAAQREKKGEAEEEE